MDRHATRSVTHGVFLRLWCQSVFGSIPITNRARPTCVCVRLMGRQSSLESALVFGVWMGTQERNAERHCFSRSLTFLLLEPNGCLFHHTAPPNPTGVEDNALKFLEELNLSRYLIEVQSTKGPCVQMSFPTLCDSLALSNRFGAGALWFLLLLDWNSGAIPRDMPLFHSFSSSLSSSFWAWRLDL